MNKEEFIRRYGEAAWGKMRGQSKDWNAQFREEHHEEINANLKEWRAGNQDKVQADHREEQRKGGRRYEKHLAYKTTGIPGEKERTRGRHNYYYAHFKKIIAPESQLHHQWIPETANYTGVALVEADPHRHGIIAPIQILEGEITLLTEKGLGR